MNAAERTQPLNCLSLFASAGIGELGVRAAGVEILVANEIIQDRCGLYRHNHPDTHLVEGDIWEQRDEIRKACQEKLNGDELFLAYATPPCQGMSTNGAGKIKSEIAAGRRPVVDERNRLVIPAMDIIAGFRPRWVLFENVPGMKDTIIEVDGAPCSIVDYIASRLGPEYSGGCEVVACSDFGIPQLRRRLITVFTRDDNGKRHLREHCGSVLIGDDREPSLSIWDAIGALPPLDASEGQNAAPEFHPLHEVGVMSREKYWWVSNTPEGDTAFNNQCVNPICLFQGNRRHEDETRDGRAVSSKTTPLHCSACGELLPRPTMIDRSTGERRLISGFHSAYRRMESNKPARTLTRNFPFEASDNKIHPTQNRVLSVYEALVLQTVTRYEYDWVVDGRPSPRSLIAQAIGESVPPLLIEKLVRRLTELTLVSGQEGRTMPIRGQVGGGTPVVM